MPIDLGKRWESSSKPKNLKLAPRFRKIKNFFFLPW